VAIHGGEGEHGVHLQVWRPTLEEEGREKQQFELVGSNYLKLKPETREITLLYFDPGRRVVVQSGDIIGFFLEDDPLVADDYRLQYQQATTASMVLYTPAEKASKSIETDSFTMRLLNRVPTISVQLGE
jgi:hypothetical protein